MSSDSAATNRVLARLPTDNLDQLLAVSTTSGLESGESLHRFGEITTKLIFPLTGMVSLTVPTPEGDNVEVALVGREGVVGVNSLLDGATSDLQAMVQVQGEMITTPVERISPETRTLLRLAADKYAAGLLIELAQTAACNRLHSVEERTARWLLHAADRANTDDLNLTHDFMAMMLGVRRASVTVEVSGFEAAGLISAKRRLISLTNRPGLEEIACSCYEVIRQATAIGDA